MMNFFETSTAPLCRDKIYWFQDKIYRFSDKNYNKSQKSLAFLHA